MVVDFKRGALIWSVSIAMILVFFGGFGIYCIVEKQTSTAICFFVAGVVFLLPFTWLLIVDLRHKVTISSTEIKETIGLKTVKRLNVSDVKRMVVIKRNYKGSKLKLFIVFDDGSYIMPFNKGNAKENEKGNSIFLGHTNAREKFIKEIFDGVPLVYDAD